MPDQLSEKKPTDDTKGIYSRLWIYSHHLYSNVKRRNIEKKAKDLDLNGLSCPGKPGVIIIEGQQEKCQEFWDEIRSWSWRRIVLRHSEESTDPANFIRLRKFHELYIESKDGRTSDMSILKNTLADVNLEYGFKFLFGI